MSKKVIIDKVGGGHSGIRVDVNTHEECDGKSDGFEQHRVTLDQSRTFNPDGSVNWYAIDNQVEERLGVLYPGFEIEWGAETSRPRQAEEPAFICPACGGSHFGRDTGGDPPGPLATVRCHDERQTGCVWRGEWPPIPSGEQP